MARLWLQSYFVSNSVEGSTKKIPWRSVASSQTGLMRDKRMMLTRIAGDIYKGRTNNVENNLLHIKACVTFFFPLAEIHIFNFTLALHMFVSMFVLLGVLHSRQFSAGDRASGDALRVATQVQDRA